MLSERFKPLTQTKSRVSYHYFSYSQKKIIFNSLPEGF